MRNPIGVAGPAGLVFDVLGGAGVALIAATGLAAIVSLVFRYRRARTVEREQLKWLVYAGGLIVAAVLAVALIEKILGPSAASTNLQNAISSGTAALVPVAIGIAIFRYHLYDIDVVINKTLVYGSLAVFITAVYVAIVVGVGSLAHGARPSLGLSIAATAVVAVAFQPVRSGSSAWQTGWSTASGPSPTRFSPTSPGGWRGPTPPRTCCRGWPGSWPRAPRPPGPMSG